MKNIILLLVLFCSLQCSSTPAQQDLPATNPVQAESQVIELPASYYENAGFNVSPASPRQYKAIFEPADVQPDPYGDEFGSYDTFVYDSLDRIISLTPWGNTLDTLPPGVIYDGEKKSTWELDVTNTGEVLKYAPMDSCYCYFDKQIAEEQGQLIMILTTEDIHDAVVATICTSNYRGPKKLVIKCQWQDLFHYVRIDQELVREYMIPNSFNHILLNICPDCK